MHGIISFESIKVEENYFIMKPGSDVNIYSFFLYKTF